MNLFTWLLQNMRNENQFFQQKFNYTNMKVNMANTDKYNIVMIGTHAKLS